MKELFNRFMSTRLGKAIFLVLVFIVLCAVLAAMFCAIAGDFEKFNKAFEVAFWFFGASGVVGAILCILTTLPDDYVFGFGLGLYYGSLACAVVIHKLWASIPFDAALFLGSVIAAETCYIVWLKVYKDS